MRAFFKGLLLIVCILFILGLLMDRNDPPKAPLMVVGVVSGGVLTLTLLLRRWGRHRYWPVALSFAGGLFLIVWGAANYRPAGEWSTLGAGLAIIAGVCVLIATAIAWFVLWIVGGLTPRE